MSKDFEFIILGSGGVGSSAAYHLSRAGKSVLALEQFEIGHNRGASHGESRIIRYSYEKVEYIRMAVQAYKLWAQVEEELGRKLLTKTGGLDLGWPETPGSQDFQDCIDSLTRENIAHEVIDAKEVRRRFPQFQVPDRVRGLWQADSGVLSPDECVPAIVELARRHGAIVYDNTTVSEIDVESNSVKVVTTSGESFKGKRLIVTPGAWAGEVLRQLGVSIPLTVTCEQYAFFEPADKSSFQPDKFPVFINYGEEPLLYGFPQLDSFGVKVAEHHGGVTTTADARSFEAEPGRLERLAGRMQRLLPGLTPAINKSATCLYTTTPDRHFIIDKLPGRSNVFVGAGFSGHGFKFTIFVGQLLMELATDQKTTCSIDMFNLARLIRTATQA